MTKLGYGLFVAIGLAVAAPAMAGNGVSAEEAEEVWSLRACDVAVDAGAGGDVRSTESANPTHMACCSHRKANDKAADGAATLEEDLSWTVGTGG